MAYKAAYIWNGTTFDNFGVQAVQTLNDYQPITKYISNPPSLPVTGQMWVDSDTLILYFYDGTSWKEIGGTDINSFLLMGA